MAVRIRHDAAPEVMYAGIVKPAPRRRIGPYAESDIRRRSGARRIPVSVGEKMQFTGVPHSPGGVDDGPGGTDAGLREISEYLRPRRSSAVQIIDIERVAEYSVGIGIRK
ncbi:hypothetical protein SDC9_178059 [bioreactor metagenome]|uniref:Uncharacterized protein n=1 Tax=bioreactor metagenome TaxID=1076179 RepID=A0A645GUR8_9ZZZZ